MTGDPEVAAVESALSALAFAQTDGALERAISRLLPGLLSALGTKSAAARARIVQALQHINVRVRGVPTLKLPFAAVLEAASAPTAALMTTNVTIQGGYVTRCFDRLSPAERSGALQPLVVAAHALRARSRANVDVLLSLAVQSIGASRGRWVALADAPEEAVDALWEYALRALRRKTKVAHSADDLRALVGLCSEYAGVKMPHRAAKVFPHLLVSAGCVSDSTIADAGVDALKRVDATEELLKHRPGLVDIFFELFSAEDADFALRGVVLAKGLLRSPESTEKFPSVLHVLNEALYKPRIPMRLRASGMQYLSYVIKHAPQAVITVHECDLRTGIMGTINAPGDIPYAARAFMYTALVQLIARVPNSIREHDRFVPELIFTAAQDVNEPAEVRAAAVQSLAILAATYTGATSEQSNILAILKKTLANQSDVASGARASAVLWANQCFPFANEQARLLNIVASADKRTEVREAALAGLSPKRYRNLSLVRDLGGVDKNGNELETAKPGVLYPDFVQLVWAVRDEAASNEEGLVLYLEAWASFFHFALRTLKENAKGEGPRGDLETLANYVDKNAEVKAALESLRNYADQHIMARTFDTSARMKRSALSVVLTVAQLERGDSSVARAYAPHLTSLLENCTQCSVAGAAIIVEAYAALIGVASKALAKEEVVELLQKIGLGLKARSDGSLDSRQGEHERVANILTLGHVVTEQVRGGKSSAFDEHIQAAARIILGRVSDTVEPSQSVRAAACRATALVGVLGPLFSVSGTEGDKSAIEIVAKAVKASNSETELVEVACIALGGICVGAPTCANIRTALETLFELSMDKKEDEIRFTAAESLVQVATGFNIPPPRVLDETTKSAEDDDLQELLRRPGISLSSHEAGSENRGKVTLLSQEYSLDVPGILDACVELCLHQRPQARAGGGLYLFTFLRLIGTPHGKSLSAQYRFATPTDEERFKSVQGHVGHILTKAQRAFTTQLSDRSDLVQQLASRGIALVYELSPPGAQEDLVHSLVRSLTVNKARAGSTVSGDEGGLVDLPGLPAGSSGAGKSATSTSKTGGATYKELCSLAQDMGQPDLVYKFMDLAGHTALWNSRRGAALAGSSLLDTDIAAKQLQPHAKTLLPRLYVYCYDPSESIRLAMSSVLRAVAKAAGHKTVVAAVTALFPDIVKHCLKSIVSTQWRVREAGCAALRDALASRKWEEVEDWVKEFWYITLRAMDDIKESVRKSAWGLGRALSELSIFLCDPAQSGLENASKAVAIVVPALLSAFTHRVDEVRALANHTLSKILRFGGNALRESIPDVAYCMLESATEVEPQILNYAQFHVEEKEELESARAKIASDSTAPWIEALERIVGLVDEDVAKELVPKLTQLARSGVGVPTRAATARFISSLLRSCAGVMGKHAARIMKACLTAARMDANSTLRRSWCAALGMAAKLASVDAVGKICAEMRELAGSEDSKDRALASFVAIGLWRQAPDTVRRHAAELLPVAYMGMFETDGGEDATANWVDVWSEGCPSSDAGLRVYATEICDICCERLEESQQYKVKQGAAVAIGALADASNESVNVELLAKAASALIRALPGRIFDGKEAVVDAFGSIADCDKAKEVWEKVGGAENVVNIVLKECFRGKAQYRSVALAALKSVLKSARSPSHDSFPRIVEQLQPVWSKTEDSAASKSSTSTVRAGSDANAVDERNKARKALRAATVVALECAEAAYVGETGEKSAQEAHFVVLVDAVKDVMHFERDVRAPMLECLARAVERTEKSVVKGAALDAILECSDCGVGDKKFAKVRRAGIALLQKTGEKVGDGFWKGVGENLKASIREVAERDADPLVQADAKNVRFHFEGAF